MKFAHALAFSIAAPVANLGALTVGAALRTGADEGFTPELTATSLRTVGHMLSPGFLIMLAFAAAVSFGAWIMVRRAKRLTMIPRFILLGLSALVVAALPLGLASIAFDRPLIYLVIVLTVSASAVAIAARGSVHPIRPASTSPIPSHRISFARRGHPPTT
jgi:hypothetical protein